MSRSAGGSERWGTVLRRLATRWSPVGGSRLLFECRRCGTTVDRGVTTCPVCGSDGIARYEL